MKLLQLILILHMFKAFSNDVVSKMLFWKLNQRNWLLAHKFKTQRKQTLCISGSRKKDMHSFQSCNIAIMMSIKIKYRNGCHQLLDKF